MLRFPGYAVALFAGLILAGVTTDARADIIILTGTGVQATDQGENILFNEGSLISEGFTVQGIGKDSGTVFDISSDIELSATGGQAAVTALNSGDVFDLFYFRPNDTSLGLSYFEASVSVKAESEGSATLTACNQNGGFGSTAPFDSTSAPSDQGPCEAATWDLKNGNNFFVIQVADLQILRGLQLVTTTGIIDVSQIRVNGITQLHQDDVTPTAVPEPASLILLGTGLLAGVRGLRRRSAPKTL